MIIWLATLLPMLSRLLDEDPAPETLPLIAIVNGIVWVGLFLLLLGLLARGSNKMGDQLSKLEASAPDENKPGAG